ncbi:hypothetical protein [Evansella clarkii]|jgi:hypothetical protein|uniref:hypothetical protein n=1 Tax=Evansella clarkii TaxID=79879 RepID=UPI000997A018|nr:hypothetical protein [Evansella clarkii]
MMFPKVTIALLTSIITALLLPAVMPIYTDFNYFQNIFLYALYGAPVIFTYGILTSMLADFLSRRAKWKHKRTLSFFFHLAFGAAFILPAGLIFGPGAFTDLLSFLGMLPVFLICSAVFFIVNEAVMKFA